MSQPFNLNILKPLNAVKTDVEEESNWFHVGKRKASQSESDDDYATDDSEECTKATDGIHGNPVSSFLVLEHPDRDEFDEIRQQRRFCIRLHGEIWPLAAILLSI